MLIEVHNAKYSEGMKLCIFGSRTLYDERVKILILETILKFNPELIITSAEPEGVCQMGRDIAKERAIPLKLHFLNFKYLRGAFEHRSIDILKEVDFVLFIHDGKSKGTLNEKKLADKMKIPYQYEVLEVQQFKKSVGFEIEKDWDVVFTQDE
jgi:hypothetical protein